MYEIDGNAKPVDFRVDFPSHMRKQNACGTNRKLPATIHTEFEKLGVLAKIDRRATICGLLSCKVRATAWMRESEFVEAPAADSICIFGIGSQFHSIWHNILVSETN